jgi:hypothetical protein
MSDFDESTLIHNRAESYFGWAGNEWARVVEVRQIAIVGKCIDVPKFCMQTTLNLGLISGFFSFDHVMTSRIEGCLVICIQEMSIVLITRVDTRGSSRTRAADEGDISFERSKIIIIIIFIIVSTMAQDPLLYMSHGALDELCCFVRVRDNRDCEA